MTQQEKAREVLGHLYTFEPHRHNGLSEAYFALLDAVERYDPTCEHGSFMGLL